MNNHFNSKLKCQVLRSRGLSLIELLVGLCILSIALIALTSIGPTAILHQQKMLHTQIAAAAARSELDTLAARAAGISTDSQWNTAFSVGSTTTTNTVNGLPDGTTKTVEITQYPTDSENRYLRQVTVVIEWPASGGKPSGEIVYRTLITKPYWVTDGTLSDI